MLPVRDNKAARRRSFISLVLLQGQDQDKDQDQDRPVTQPSIIRCIITNSEDTNSSTALLNIKCDLCPPMWLLFLININQQPLLHTLSLFFSHKHTHSHMHPLSFKGMPVLSFKMQGDDILQEKSMLAATHLQGHTQPCCCMPVKRKKHTEMNERDALPFLPLVLHPTLFSFPSRVHTVSEEGIHSREERRRKRSKRVRK